MWRRGHADFESKKTIKNSGDYKKCGKWGLHFKVGKHKNVNFHFKTYKRLWRGIENYVSEVYVNIGKDKKRNVLAFSFYTLLKY